jgi:hypothetical protein
MSYCHRTICARKGYFMHSIFASSKWSRKLEFIVAVVIVSLSSEKFATRPNKLKRRRTYEKFHIIYKAQLFFTVLQIVHRIRIVSISEIVYVPQYTGSLKTQEVN